MEEENKEEEKKEKSYEDKLLEATENVICEILEDGIHESNLEYLGKLVDIHKDVCNENYWKIKEENIMYREGYNDYNDYGRRGVPGTGRGRYSRRGVPGTGRRRYRGENPMDEMMDHYENYSDSYEEMYNGNYGAEDGMVKSAEGIMKNIYKIVEELSEADSPEVMSIIKKYAKKINEMG